MDPRSAKHQRQHWQGQLMRPGQQLARKRPATARHPVRVRLEQVPGELCGPRQSLQTPLFRTTLFLARQPSRGTAGIQNKETRQKVVRRRVRRRIVDFLPVAAAACALRKRQSASKITHFIAADFLPFTARTDFSRIRQNKESAESAVRDRGRQK